MNVLSAACEKCWGSVPSRVSYTHLSGWKAGGAYRINVRLPDGRRDSLVYKEARYDLDQIPALARLPLTPGPPEFTVYSSNPGPLTEFLPKIFHCEEVRTKAHYRYIMEDLTGRFREPESQEDILMIVRRLSSLHKALLTWARSVDKATLLRYDAAFSAGLRSYVEQNLRRYRRKVTSTALDRVVDLLADIHEIVAPSDRDRRPLQPIHGDLNQTNVLIDNSEATTIKLVDWEWTGWGTPHADLASLLKTANENTIEAALAEYAKQRPEMSLDEHRSCFHRCQLERGVLDAAFLAAQRMEQTADTDMNMPRHIERAIARALDSLGRLETQRGRS